MVALQQHQQHTRPLRPFDAHNHIHMGPSQPIQALLGNSNVGRNVDGVVMLDGMAIMSTHPRDYSRVLDLCYNTLPQGILQNHNNQQQDDNNSNDEVNAKLPLPMPIFVPCIGVHPWFVNELTDVDWELVDSSSIFLDDDGDGNDVDSKLTQVPRWIYDIHNLVTTPPPPPLETVTGPTLSTHHHQPPIIGEIGLDKFQYHPVTKELVCPMEKQIQALYYQLCLATQLHLPVSIHCVHAMGPIMTTLHDVQKDMGGKLPPKLYFHAFGGKEATVDQILSFVDKSNKALKKKKKKMKPREIQDAESSTVSTSSSLSPSSSTTATTTTTTAVYFGFAPVINFRSPKTMNVIRKIGLEKLVLETDHEDSKYVLQSMEDSIKYLSQALDVTPTEIILQTTKNAYDLYGIRVASTTTSTT